MALTINKTYKYKALIVDDDIHVRNIVKEMLSIMDHSCHLAADGVEALSKVNEESFDVVITDARMPRMDGITLARELRKINPNLPIMLMTGFADIKNSDKLILGAKGAIILKPFTAEEFFFSFNEMMRNAEINSNPFSSGL